MRKGTVKFLDVNTYLTWYQELPVEEANRIGNYIKNQGKAQKNHPASTCAGKMFNTFEGLRAVLGGDYVKVNWEQTRTEYLETIKGFLSVSDTYGIPLRIGEWVEDQYAFVYMGNPDKGIIVPEPEKYLEHIPDRDYSHMSPAQVRASLMLPSSAAQMEIIPAEASQISIDTVADQKSVYEDALKKANEELENIRNANTGELASLKAEIQRMQAELQQKKDALMAELREKMEAMTEMKESLERQIYLLDSQIYNILCFAGEVVEFKKIRNGKNAPSDYPIVIHQKLHFLDDDLGRLASIYEIQWNEIHLFEKFLENSPIALDTFLPNERCVSLIRISKTGTILGENDLLPFQNLLKDFEYYHGRTIGILIRNGENVYLGWTDEKRVHIEDDLILTPGKIEYSQEPMPEFRFESDRDAWIRSQKDARKKIVDGLISRSFVYNILQGVVEHSDILPLPSGVTLGKQSEYVVYSVADGWLTDNRFGSFDDIVERCNEKVMKGDFLLTTRHLIAEHDYTRHDHRWCNRRGRGDANRTHDVAAEDCTIYPCNLVEHDEPVRMLKYKYSFGTKEDGTENWNECETKKETAQLSNDCIITGEYDRIDSHVFISLEKRYSYDKARANFEIFPDEYINLTYMNSVWLEWVITNKTLGGWTVRNKVVTYSYAIRYLKTALDFIRKREEKEKELLDAVSLSITGTPDWQVALSEWKLTNNVRQITEYQARRFAKHFYEHNPVFM